MTNIPTLDARISSKVRPAELIIACAIVLPDNRLIVSTRWFEECNMLADRFAPGVDWTKAQEWYLTSSGIFVDKDRANKIAYLARQVQIYKLKLEVTDLFL